MLFVFFLAPGLTISQPFEIAWGVYNNFSTDKFSNEVYYYFLPANKIYKTSLKTLVSVETGFPTLPRFANKSHKAIYNQHTDLYISDFDLDSTHYLFSNSKGNSDSYVFSPNDSVVFWYDRYYSFKDSQVYNLSFKIDYWEPEYFEWSSDSTILSSIIGNVIVQYYLYSNRVDTLFFISPNVYFTGYSYNGLRNILAYSTDVQPPNLYLYDFTSQGDSIVFNPILDDTSQVDPCWRAPIAMTSLSWSPNEDKLAFFNDLLTNSGGGLYTYGIDSGYVQMLIDCQNYGNKYKLEWLRNDTLIYYDATNGLIYGIDTKIVINEVGWELDGIIPNKIYITNYPNPFNSSTTISIFLPEFASLNISIYSLLGEKVMNLSYNKPALGWVKYNWNGRSIKSNELSTGIYIVKINGIMNSKLYTANHKIILLK